MCLGAGLGHVFSMGSGYLFNRGFRSCVQHPDLPFNAKRSHGFCSGKSSHAPAGVIQVFARHPSFFSSAAVQHMQAAAGVVAAAAAAAARAQKSVEHVSQGVPVTAGRIETCAMMSATVCALLKCERCVFYVYDPMSSCLVHWKTEAAQIVCSIDRGLAGVCARSMVAFKVDYAYLDPNYDADVDCQHDTPVKSILSCPLTNR